MKIKKFLKFSILATVLVLCLCALPVFAAEPVETSPKLNIDYCNLSFENDVNIMYAVRSDDASLKLLVWTEEQKEHVLGTQNATLSTLSERPEIEPGVNYSIFKFDGLVAKQMTDVVYARACIVDGEGNVTYGNTNKYSILQYAYGKLGYTGVATKDEKLKTALNEMLEYGAAMQNYLDYKTDRFATADWSQIKLAAGTFFDGFNVGLFPVGSNVKVNIPDSDSAEVPARGIHTDINGDKICDSCNENTAPAQAQKMDVFVENVTANAGSEITVNVRVDNNLGVACAMFTIVYGEGLTLKSVSNGTAFEGIDFVKSASLESGNAFIACGSLDTKATDNGIIATLAFVVSAEAEGVIDVSLMCSENEVFDINLNNIECEITNGSVTIA